MNISTSFQNSSNLDDALKLLFRSKLNLKYSPNEIELINAKENET